MEAKPYTPYGACRGVWKCRDDRVLIDGPAGTGKTRGVLEKLHCAAMKYPNMQGAIGRKIRADLTQSVLQEFEDHVILNDPRIRKVGGDVSHRIRYDYPNGAKIWCFGMDNASRIMSTQKDVIACFEATDFTAEDIDFLDVRCRAGNMPYQQLICDCNPRGPNHHLKRAADAGKMTRFAARHTDNPRFWNAEKGEWTADGAAYLRRLDRLEGPRRAWLLDGKWIAAEGVVYGGFDYAQHVLIPEEGRSIHIPAEWRRIRVIDFGYEDPFVCQWWAIDPEGRAIMYREMYFSRRIVADHAWQIRVLSEGEKIETTISDHDREDRATLHACGIPTVPAKKAIAPGIQKVMARLRKDRHGVPGIRFLSTALVERDRQLADDNRPTRTIDEFECYIFPTAKEDKNREEEPVDKDNHGCFIAGTLVRTSRGDIPIESVKAGDVVMTPHGDCRVLDSAMTSRKAATVMLTTETGKVLVGTKNHPIWTPRGWLRMDCLRYGDIIATCQSTPKSCTTGDASIVGIQTQRTGQPVSITETDAACCISKSGGITADPFRAANKFTTATEIQETTTSRIWNSSRPKNTRINTGARRGPLNNGPLPNASVHSRPLGTELPKESSGTEGTQSTSDSGTSIRTNSCANGANPSLSASGPRRLDSALTTANQAIVGLRESMTRREVAKPAETIFDATDSSKPHVALDRVRSVCDGSPQPVFNLTVEAEHVYFANGILVSNCDCVRYLCAHLDGLQESIRVFAGDSASKIRQHVEPELYSGEFEPLKIPGNRERWVLAGNPTVHLRTADEGAWKLWIAVNKDPKCGIYRPESRSHYVFGAAIVQAHDGYIGAVCVSRRETRDQVAEAIIMGTTPEGFAELLASAARWFGGVTSPHIIWEANEPGIVMGKELLKLRYPSLHFHRETDRRGAKQTDKYGWRPSKERIERLLIDSRRMLATGTYTIKGEATAAACERMVIYEGGGAGPWEHEDTRDAETSASRAQAIALSLSMYAVEHVPLADAADRDAPRGTLAYWERVEEEAERKRRREFGA